MFYANWVTEVKPIYSMQLNQQKPKGLWEGAIGSSDAFAVARFVIASRPSSKVKVALFFTRADAKCSAMLAR